MTELRKLSASFLKEAGKPHSVLMIQLKRAIDELVEETKSKAKGAKEAMPAESRATGAEAGSRTESGGAGGKPASQPA